MISIPIFIHINQTLSIKLKAHFTAIIFQKAVVLHFFIRINDKDRKGYFFVIKKLHLKFG